MRLPISWLKDYVDIQDTPQGIADRLTFSGTEVEGLEVFGSTYEGLVVGEIMAVERHPNADKLTLCTVRTGTGEQVVVCGAPNARVGLKVPFAPAGITLPNGTRIKAAKIRGVESHGMLCAEDELALSEDHRGLLELEAHWTPGTPLAEVLGPPEAVLELSITSNRPDCLSVIGIARELSALYGVPLKWPDLRLPENDTPVESLTRVSVDDPEGCPRYTARILQNVSIRPSPSWMRRRLEHAGIRAINNVVDITNYVMLECGQPLHAFDQTLLSEGRIVVRRARPGESLATLDGIGRPVTPEMLVIADAERPVAVAGIMGGAGSEIRVATDTVLLESACFNPPLTRRTSKHLGLSTESSYRFERGVDIGLAEWASRRAAALMTECAGAVAARGVVDVYPRPAAERTIVCRFDRVHSLLGMEAPAERIRAVFSSLGLTVEQANDQQCTVRVPTGRVDLEAEVDLIEEFARIQGLEHIPTPTPRAQVVPSADDRLLSAVFTCRASLVGLGLREIMNYSFVSGQLLDLFGIPPARRVPLPNPVSQEHSFLRTALTPQMTDTLGRNLARQIEAAAFFEIVRVFFTFSDGRPLESENLSIGLMGPVGRGELERRRPYSTEDAFMALKGVWEGLCNALRLDTPLIAGDTTWTEPGMALAIQMDGQSIGQMGLLKANVRSEWRMNQPVALLEVELAPLLTRMGRRLSLRGIPAYPSVGRDVALIVNESVRHEDLIRVIREAAPPELEKVEIFDIFKGKSLGAGRKSMAYALRYRSPKRTLTDEEANQYHDAIKAALKRELGAEIREG